MDSRQTTEASGAASAPEASGETVETDVRQTCGECPIREWSEALREVEGTMRGLLPPAFWQHRRAAHKEALLAVRSLLDSAIEHMDKEPEVRANKAPRKIVVQ